MQQDTARSVEHFVASISFDQRLAQYDIAGSQAHARMLEEAGLLTGEEFAAIDSSLNKIAAEIADGKFNFDEALEDIHMNVESALIARTGEAGKKLHTARSRNDQVALDLRLWARDEVEIITNLLRDVQKALVEQAAAAGDAYLPAYTHLQPAQPVALGHALLCYVEQLQRDIERLADCRRRINILPLGAGAVAGTTLPINRRRVAELLGFDGVAANSIDATSDRDFAIELAFCLSMVAQHLSRWAEDWILWSSNEFRYLRLSDAYSTGSSMMPQKRNPDVLELIRGKTARVYGQLLTLLVLVKGQPHAYNRDMQEDKPAIFDAADQVRGSLLLAAEIIRQVRFNVDQMRNRCQGGYLDATALAEYLVDRGEPFRSAHGIAGRIVAACDEQKLELADAPLELLRKFGGERIGEDVYDRLGPENVVAAYRSEGAGGTRLVAAEIRRWQEALK